jgi:Cyclophilin type peptidyl-prolyl cis-trans isomerase/CLD
VFVAQGQVQKKTASTASQVKKSTSTPVKPNPPVTVQPAKASGVRVSISTDLGEIIVRLSDKTPQHRDNFIKLVNEHFYDSLLFHRIIAGFMIQGGDPTSRYAPPDIMLEVERLGTPYRLSLILPYIIKKEHWRQPEPITRKKPAVVASFILYMVKNMEMMNSI